MPPHRDITGQTFGCLTALYRDTENRDRYGYYNNWVWLCICGKYKSIYKHNVLFGTTVSCGCKSQYLPKRNGKSPAFNLLYKNYKNSAIRRELDFKLTYDEFELLIFRNCFYCGTAPSNNIKKRGYELTYNGIDRVDSSKGYSMDNVRTCCKVCNRAKSDLSEHEFYNWLLQISTHWLLNVNM